jgi:hypothetical protein
LEASVLQRRAHHVFGAPPGQSGGLRCQGQRGDDGDPVCSNIDQLGAVSGGRVVLVVLFDDVPDEGGRLLDSGPAAAGTVADEA